MSPVFTLAAACAKEVPLHMIPAGISLLTPPEFDRTTCDLSDSTIADLDLDYLISSFADRHADERPIRRFLTCLPADTDAIRHRQGVFRDVLGSDKLRTALAGFLPLGHELNYFSQVHKEQETPFLQARQSRRRPANTKKARSPIF